MGAMHLNLQWEDMKLDLELVQKMDAEVEREDKACGGKGEGMGAST